jgi:hypothetical protein
MARIRSVHPGLFTDDKFAACSLGAQVLFVGIWTECDDHGLFEWNPIKLKMRLMPVHNVDVSVLLEELAESNLVRSFSYDDHQLGAVRNFTKFQRPKKPKYVHFIPHDLRTYVGLTAASTEAEACEPEQVPKKEEQPPQMEEGGGRMKEEGKKEREPRTRRSSTARGTRLAADWKPSEKNIADALAMGVPRARITREGSRFRDHYIAQPSKAGVKLDWDATWRNWNLRLCDQEGYAQPLANGNGSVGVHVKRGTPQWTAWEDFYRATKGKAPPVDAQDGWLFPTEYPPKSDQLELVQ